MEPMPEPPAGYAPRAIGSGEPLDREALLAAPVRSPRPGILDAPLTKLKGAGPKLSEAAAEIGVYEPRRPAAPPAALLPRPGLAGRPGGPEAGGGGDGRGRGDEGRQGAAHPPSPADDPGGRGRRRERPRDRDLVQPGVARGQADRPGRGCCCAASSRSAASTSPSTSCSPPRTRSGAGGMRAKPDSSPVGIHTTGLVAVHPASERLRPQKLREWAWQAAPLASQRARAVAVAGARAGGDARGRRRPGRLALPRRRGSGGRSAASARVRGAAALPGLAGEPGGGAAPRAAAAPRSDPPGEQVGRWLDSLPVRADRRPARRARRPRRATWPGPSRCSGC